MTNTATAKKTTTKAATSTKRATRRHKAGKAELTAKIENLPIDQVFPNPDQPRKQFEADGIRELAESIKASGLLQPITVVKRMSAKGEGYMIVAGERRWRACQEAGLKHIAAIVRVLDAGEVRELALIENLLRRDLNVIEEARAYQGFMQKNKCSEKALAKLLGHATPQRVQDRLSLLKLDAAFQDGVIKGAVGAVEALELSRLSIEGQFKLWRHIQDGKCSTRGKLRRMAAAIADLENQTEMFEQVRETPEQKAAMDKVDRFLESAGKLLNLITNDDLSVCAKVLRNDAPATIAKLVLLGKTCYQVANAIESGAVRAEAAGAAKQEAAQ